MYRITDSILKSGVYSALTEPTREFQQRISFGEGSGANFIKHISFIKGITKIEISQEGNSDSSGLVLGSCCASSCVAEFYNPDKTYNYAGKTMFIECGVKYPFKVSYEDKTGGYYMTSNGKWVDGENVYSKVTNLIPVFEGDSFVYTGRGEWGAASVLWYDENKSFLSGEEYYSEDTRDHVTTVTIEAPDGAAWAVFQTFDYDSDVTLEVSKADDSFFYIPCGYYKVDKPETVDDWRTVSITAYDCIDEMTGKWNTSLSMPSNAYLLFEEIATRYGLALEVESGVLAEMKSRTVTEAQALALTAYTEREVCGFLAGLFGANARINTVGKLSVKRYQNSPTDDFCILAAVQWQNGFKKSSEEEFVVNSVTSGIDDAVFTAGTGAGISFSNPIITEDEISAVYDVYADVSFQPSSCEWRGNPCVECGDTVAVTDRNGNSYTVLVASQVIDLTGGLSMNTHCPGGDSEISFDTVDERTRAALNRQYTALQQAIIDASNALNGARGGYYEVLDNDNDGNPDGWLIKQFQDGSGGLILANHEGIGFSSDGGKNYRTAIGFNGINADCITTGKLNAERIDTSTLVVGGENYDDLEALLNGVVDTANSSITKVDVLYGKNQSATTPPSSWSTDAPVWQNGYYIWTKTQTTAGGKVTETDPVCITGAKGETGATGSTGADGLGVSKIEEQYYLSTSNTTAPAENASGWSTNQPEWEKNKYIWTRSKVTWDDNSVTYTTAVLAKAINGANSTANSANDKIANWASANNTTLIDGAKIYTGSITAEQIASNSITADKLSVGLSKRENLYYNPEFTENYSNGSTTYAKGWQSVNGTLTPKDGWIILRPNSSTSRSGIFQSVWLKPGVYSIVAQMNIYNVTSVSSSGKIGYILGKVSDQDFFYDNVSLNIGNQSAVNQNKEINVKYVVEYTGEEGFVDVGLYVNGMTFSGYISVAWMALFNADEEIMGANFYSSDSTWLKSPYKSSNLLTYASNPNAFIHSVNPFTVNDEGQLDVISGNIGCLKFSRLGLNVESHVSDSILGITFDGYLSVSKPTGASALTQDLDSDDLVGMSKAFAPCIDITSDEASRSFVGVYGYYCTDGEFSSTVRPREIRTTGTMEALSFNNISKEETKKNIVSKSSVLNKIKNSRIYEYAYKKDGEKAKRKTGFIIERETPEEIISDSGNGINLYSMASMNWKATQELLERLEAVERAVKINA